MQYQAIKSYPSYQAGKVRTDYIQAFDDLIRLTRGRIKDGTVAEVAADEKREVGRKMRGRFLALAS